MARRSARDQGGMPHARRPAHHRSDHRSGRLLRDSPMTVASPSFTPASGKPHEGMTALAAHDDHGAFAWISRRDHKRIGILYLLPALFFFAIGGGEALLIRLQLAQPNEHLLAPETFN